jgi:hypothetical protein
MLYRRWRRGILPHTEIRRIASWCRAATAATLFSDAEVDNIDHARHFILDILWERRR